jgi:hypothetical protein
MGAVVLGDVPALPLHEAGKYVAGAYVVLFALVLVYVAIMAIRLSRIERELGELLEQSADRTPGAAPPTGVPGQAASARESSPSAVEAQGGQRESTLAYPIKGHT